MSENKYGFVELTPTSKVDLYIYEDAINFIFTSDNIRNVAISGPYGAGKSSVLESYKKKYNNLRFVHISLAHFKSPDHQDDEVKGTVLEGKILNQLIHQISPIDIPQTNFKVKKRVDFKDIMKTTVLTILLVISILHIVYFEVWDSFVTSLSQNYIQLILNLFTSNYSLLLSGLLCIFIAGNFVYRLVHVQKNKNIFRRINLQEKIEIEIFQESEESYFDKYLNEVLYLFENVEADVIVFEDMDRFNASEIFERLREVNTLVNIQLKNDHKPPLRFFYLLRDDIFTSKDRTKFFDYIVPIVPVIDSSNSYDKFISYFKKGGIFEMFNENFLQGLSLYVDDMRVLKNIYNEFIIYYYRLNTTKLDCNKMLAMITYKNLFPRDFSDLQLNQGMVFTLFDKKNEFIREEIERLKAEIVQKKKEIELAQNEHLISIEELNHVYEKKRTGVSSWKREEVRAITRECDLRKQAIENRENNRLHDLEDELSNLEHEVIIIQNKQLKDIITRDNIDSIFKVTATNEIGIEKNFNEVKGSEYFALLKYLIWEGYIDETYSDYMTYFYENSLSRIDKTFLRSITDRKAEEYTYRLQNPKLVTDRLRLVDFDKVEILNLDLLQYLLKTPEHVDFLNRFLMQLKETKNFKFIGTYFDTGRELPPYVKNLNLQWPEIFSYALENNTLTERQIRLYSIYTIYYSNDDNIQVVNVGDCLTNYISKSDDYLEINEPNIEKLIYGFRLLNVSFKNINYGIANKELFNAVYENSLYEINFDNLALIFQKVYMIESEDDIRHKNYTLILTQPGSSLCQYIKQNISKYLDVILSTCNGIINDDEEIVLLVLNDEEISQEQKTVYIESLRTIITSIAEITDVSLWEVLLRNHLVLYTIENIIEYFGVSESLDSTLIEFINSDDAILDFSEVKKIYGYEKAEKFFNVSIICNEISNQKYREIITSLEVSYDPFEIAGISESKIQILIDEKVICMNSKSLRFIRENYSSQIFYYIEKNIDEYVNIITSELFILEELVEILNWSIDEEIKIKLLSFMREPISILGKEYSSVVNEYILKNNLNINDLSGLFVTFESWDSTIQQIIFDQAVKNISYIMADSKEVSGELLRRIISLNSLENNKRIDLFISLLPNLNKDSCKEYLHLLGLTNYVKLLFNPESRPRFKVDKINEKLLTAFKENDWIIDFHINEERPDYYKIKRRLIITRSVPSELL